MAAGNARSRRWPLSSPARPSSPIPSLFLDQVEGGEGERIARASEPLSRLARPTMENLTTFDRSQRKKERTMSSVQLPDDASDPWLILVDEHDQVIGHERRGRCHDGGGIRHRAFSIYLFDDEGRLLIQQRSPKKRLWPQWWSNSCCGHPLRGEATEVAAVRRLGEELGLSAPLEYAFRFSYSAEFGDAGSECELCSVFLGRLRSETVRPDSDEVMDWRLVAPKDLERDLARRRDFTPWFRMGWETLAGQV